ncbi:hypothetical protein LZ30DRAFT_214966 [Colletotrichum cereale]|nr:hypothetical protein LZ30DRAFT_214966 [Colletotrichum cereale]
MGETGVGIRIDLWQQQDAFRSRPTSDGDFARISRLGINQQDSTRRKRVRQVRLQRQESVHFHEFWVSSAVRLNNRTNTTSTTQGEETGRKEGGREWCGGEEGRREERVVAASHLLPLSMRIATSLGYAPLALFALASTSRSFFPSVPWNT